MRDVFGTLAQCEGFITCKSKRGGQAGWIDLGPRNRAADKGKVFWNGKNYIHLMTYTIDIFAIILEHLHLFLVELSISCMYLTSTLLEPESFIHFFYNHTRGNYKFEKNEFITI